jgi:uncharacterized protein with PhoU and TrkA domain
MTRFEKVKYKPVPVRTLLIEMKDLSELMIDLAYSAALFNSRPLAEEVMELERRVDNLTYLLDMNAMVAARGRKDAESLVGVTVVAAATDKISDAAADIAAIVLHDISIHPLVREAFEKMEERLTKVETKPNSILVGKRLKDLDLAAKMGVDVIAIRRNKEVIANPKGDETIKKGDIITARGAPKGVEEFEKLAEGTLQTLEG